MQNCSLTSLVPRPVEHPTTYSALIAHAGLARIANAIYQEFLSARTANAKVEYQVAEMLDHSLRTWRSSLPEYFSSPEDQVPLWFKGPRKIVLWKEQNFRILLWRETKRHHPFLPSQVDSKRRCLDTAMETIHAISSYCATEEGSLHANIAWYATYFLFQATLVIEASHLSKRSGPDEVLPSDHDSWQASVATATGCLERLTRYNHAASVCLDFIGHIHSSQRHQSIDAEAEVPNRSNVTWQDATAGDGLSDSLAWMSQVEETVTDPILRTMIDEVFWGVDATGLDACGGLLGEGGLDFC
jgi:transcriptional regulatory protein GAL4